MSNSNKIKLGLLIALIALLMFVLFRHASPEMNYSPFESNGPETPSTLDSGQDEPVAFDLSKIVQLFPIINNKKAFYLKQGNIWVADLTNQSVNLLLDQNEDVLNFDISNDQKMIAYSVRRKVFPEDEWSERNGDVLIVKDLITGKESDLYTRDNKQDLEIRDIMFSSDDRNVFFSNNSIWQAEISTRILKKYATKDREDFCRLYFLDDISPDGKNILSRIGCFEGGSQIIIEAATGVIEADFGFSAYGGGVYAIGFIKSDLILGIDNTENEGGIIKLGIYDLSGKLLRQIHESESYPIFLDNKSIPGQIFTSLSPNYRSFRDQIVYRIDPSSLTLKETSIKKDVLALVAEKNNTYGIWATNTMLENPSFVDTGLEFEKIVKLKLW